MGGGGPGLGTPPGGCLGPGPGPWGGSGYPPRGVREPPGGGSGYPPGGSGSGYPPGGGPGTPPGGVPGPGQRAVCLLRSRRRTFLFRHKKTAVDLHVNSKMCDSMVCGCMRLNQFYAYLQVLELSRRKETENQLRVGLHPTVTLSSCVSSDCRMVKHLK